MLLGLFGPGLRLGPLRVLGLSLSRLLRPGFLRVLGLFLALGAGLLFLLRPPRLLLALIVLRIGRGDGLEQQGQDAQIDESKRLHGLGLLMAAPGPGTWGTGNRRLLE
jgi:hypothetical protein